MTSGNHSSHISQLEIPCHKQIQINIKQNGYPTSVKPEDVKHMLQVLSQCPFIMHR